MGAQGLGVDRQFHRSPSLASAWEHPLTVTARETWPYDEQVHLLAADIALTCEAELRRVARHAETEPVTVFGRTVYQAVLTIRRAAYHFPSPATTTWVEYAEMRLLDLVIVRWGREALLLHAVEVTRVVTEVGR